jgi:leucyl-tRNA synthetase
MKKYEPKVIEPKWQKIWQETNLYTADLESDKPKYIAMSMFNYPSGAGLHVGHAMNFTISDVKARFKRQQGYESYHPVGWDSFGLPAENYAIKVGVSPQESMATIIPNYHKQYQAMGWSNDWEKEIATHTPEYYKWTQWIFSQMHRNKFAYQDARMQWWCNQCQTVLANEQVTSDNKCWRHEGKDDPVIEKKEVKQWFFKITDYADELLEATDELDWTESVKLAQKNWIGRSEGAEIKFSIQNYSDEITVFTTRADTLFGVTFMVLAPEHELATKIASPEQKDQVSDYIKLSAKKTEVERQAAKEKTGVFTGAYAINPINNEAVPIYVADYVLGGYGTGAIMAVPAHDERDYEFAKKISLPSREVISRHEVPSGAEAFREGVETLTREVVDTIIVDEQSGEYLLIEEPGGITHFVGGGIEAGDTDVQTVRKEIEEEVGYIDIKSIRKISSIASCDAYRLTKNKNQKTSGYAYEVVIDRSKKIDSEAEEGRHVIKWVKKDQVKNMITWGGHLFFWDQYLSNSALYSGYGKVINSGGYTNLSSEEAKLKIVADLEKKGLARLKVNYKMRDWSVSRQRYWGAPIPIINCNQCGPVLVPDSDLPVVLPELTDFAPSGDGRSALARAKDWLKVSCPECGGEGERETDTLDTYICSSWYMFRYLDPHNQEKIFNSKIANKWMPIDFYNGGDHATAHLLYARFVTRFFHKLGLVDKPEPFKQMLFNGKVTAHDGAAFSKTLGNGPDPLEIINSGYGADALRTYIMFAAPLELGARWDAQGVPGAYRFLNRLWNITQEYLEAAEAKLNDDEAKKLLIVANKTTKKVSEDLEKSLYNTAIASCMAALNDLTKLKAEITFGKSDAWTEAIETVLMCIAPFAPHITDELWQQLGHSDSINKNHWPSVDENYLQEDEITIALMVNGKLRAELKLNKDADKAEMEKAALANPRIQEFLNGQGPKKVIVVPGKLVNFVV